jgi:hypothetical protein
MMTTERYMQKKFSQCLKRFLQFDKKVIEPLNPFLKPTLLFLN